MKKRLSNNKGFSLVELIIVVAIMAILIGILAPQYMKYVEKSRFSADKDTIDEVAKAMQTLITDPDYTGSDPLTVTLSYAGDATNKGKTTISDTNLKDLTGDTVTLKSKTITSNVVITVASVADASTQAGITITLTANGTAQTVTSAGQIK